MNLLQTLWSWLNSLFAKAPALVEEDCCAEDCCEETECGPDDECCDEGECAPEDECCEEEVEELPEPEAVEAPVVSAPVGELLREILLSEGISERGIEKYEIVKVFEHWYEGAPNAVSIRASIQDFKIAQGGSIEKKLSRIQ
jgi:hypothetical protein